MFDRDIGGHNNRFSMIGQSFIYKMEKGDTMSVKLHEGALKGGGTHAFTSFVGMSIDGKVVNPIFPPSDLQNEIQN